MVTHSETSEMTTRGNDSAGMRITRLFARFIGSGYVFYLALMFRDITTQAAAMSPWWTWIAVPMVFGPPVVLGLASFRGDPTPMYRAAAATALLFVVAALLWPLAWDGTLLAADAWISTIPGLAGLAAALTWRPPWAVALLVAAVVPVQLINHYCRVPDRNGLFLPDLMFALSFCLIFVAAALMAMRTGRLLDRTRTAAHATAAAAAAAQSRSVQRARFNALIHDWVMSSLLAAARRTAREEVRQQAGLALVKLGESEPDDIEGYTAAMLIAHLRTAVADADDTLEVTVHTRDGARDVSFPSDPVRVLGAAVTEAIRNSVLHAGIDAMRRVDLTVEPFGIEIVVTDDGIGFDPAAVAPHRLGLSVSIVGRLRRLAGGTVDVRSRPGHGTTVRMSWRAR